MANHNASGDGRSRALTPRQREILALVANGDSTPDVAARLGISPGTVKTHLTAIYRTIGVRNRVQATRFYLDHVARSSDRGDDA
jgi:DNA-binding NarL/FixJ family response regulator